MSMSTTSPGRTKHHANTRSKHPKSRGWRPAQHLRATSPGPVPGPQHPAAPSANLDIGILGKVETLTEQELVDYQTLEAIVSMGWQNSAKVGIALGEIRDRRLYGTEFRAFEDYCRAKWRCKKADAYRLIAASQLFTICPQIVDKISPRPNPSSPPWLDSAWISPGKPRKGRRKRHQPPHHRSDRQKRRLPAQSSSTGPVRVIIYDLHSFTVGVGRALKEEL